MKTDLRELLALNMKESRARLHLSQVKLAAKVGTSANYIAMIELKMKFPTPEMLERLAEALEIDPSELFSMPPSPARILKRLGDALVADLEPLAQAAVKKAIREAVDTLVAAKINELETMETMETDD